MLAQLIEKMECLSQTNSSALRQSSYHLSEYFAMKNQSGQALKYAVKAWRCSENNSYHVAKCLFLIGRIFMQSEQEVNALKTIEKAQRIAESLFESRI
jgi:hypothetical protein